MTLRWDCAAFHSSHFRGMDGSVSTLALIFATAFATHHTFTAFLVGIASA